MGGCCCKSSHKKSIAVQSQGIAEPLIDNGRTDTVIDTPILTKVDRLQTQCDRIEKRMDRIQRSLSHDSFEYSDRESQFTQPIPIPTGPRHRRRRYTEGLNYVV